MEKLGLTIVGGIGGAVLTLAGALFFQAPPSRAEFVKVKTVQEILVGDVRISKALPSGCVLDLLLANL